MLFENVMVPYDESEHADSALHAAFGMVGDNPDATVHVVTIVSTGAVPVPTLAGGAFDDPFNSGSMEGYDAMISSIVQRTRSDMERVVEGARDGAACKVEVAAVLSGSAVDGIAEYVTTHGIDLVVMGRRGLGALRGMLGSVSFGVLRSVDVPVLTVK